MNPVLPTVDALAVAAASPALTANPALTVALALGAGMVAQVLARHLRIPGIVLLLGAGVLLGPDCLAVIRPEVLGPSLHVVIGFAVAVILFEGGLNLGWRRVRREAGAIQRLISLGALITAGGGALATRLILDWNWAMAILFGCLVMVTGPTVITPLLRRIRVRHRLETILETEGVLVDALGALVAVVVLEIVLQGPADRSAALGFLRFPTRLLFGIAIGLAGGGLLAVLLRYEPLVPEGLDNIFTLSLVLVIYQLSGSLVEETGVVAVIVAGMVVGNVRTPAQRELKEFKEQLTILLIGMLFVLLAADVRLERIRELGWPGIAVVLVLMLAVRPLAILACTAREGLGWRDKAFMAWIAPRGIVAAAVASLFHQRLAEAGLPGGEQMRAMVFLVIAGTVVVQGATAGGLARLLGVRRPANVGYAILGANHLARTLARLLQEDGKQEVVLIDASATAHQEAQQEKLRVVYGNALEERVLRAAGVESRRAVLGLLTSSATSLLFARRARRDHGVAHAAVAIHAVEGALDPEVLHEAGIRVLFGSPCDVEFWSVRIRRGLTLLEVWGRQGEEASHLAERARNLMLPLAVAHRSPLSHQTSLSPVDDGQQLHGGDAVHWLLLEERADEARAWLREHGWVPATEAGDQQAPPRGEPENEDEREGGRV
jgi:NhaP-type Na+/H+ or K+/H+ antiporter